MLASTHRPGLNPSHINWMVAHTCNRSAMSRQEDRKSILCRSVNLRLGYRLSLRRQLVARLWGTVDVFVTSELVTSSRKKKKINTVFHKINLLNNFMFSSFQVILNNHVLCIVNGN